MNQYSKSFFNLIRQ